MDNLTSLLTRYNSRRPHGAPRMTMEKLRKEADLLVPWMEEYLTSIGVNPYPSPKHREPEAKRGSKALRHYVYVIEHTSGYFYIGKHSSDFEFGADNSWCPIAIKHPVMLQCGFKPTGYWGTKDSRVILER